MELQLSHRFCKNTTRDNAVPVFKGKKAEQVDKVIIQACFEVLRGISSAGSLQVGGFTRDGSLFGQGLLFVSSQNDQASVSESHLLFC